MQTNNSTTRAAAALMVAASLILLLKLHRAEAQSFVPKYRIQSEIDSIRAAEFSLTIWNGDTRALNKGPFPVINGQIIYSDTTSIPLLIRISVQDKSLIKYASATSSYPVKSQHIWLVAMPGSEVVLKGHFSDFSEVYPYGDVENDKLRQLTRNYYPLLNQAVNISVELARGATSLDSQVIVNKKKDRAELNQEGNRILLKFLENEVSSIAGLYFLNDSYIRNFLDDRTLERLLNRVNREQYGQTQFFKSLEQRVSAFAYQPGKEIFDLISSRTPDGERFSTRNWRGKFYLIDFWGSWCSPCIADFPALKNLLARNREKMEVLGIASDTGGAWRRAIVAHDLPWQHILIGSGEDDFASRLNVTGYPTKILVDPNGVIVYRSTGGGEKSFEAMEEIIRAWK